MEENSALSQQPVDTMMYPLVDAPLEKDLSVPSRSAPSLTDLINPNKNSNNVCLPVSSSPATAVVPPQLSSALPSQHVVSTSITTSGSNPLQVSVKTVPGANTIVNQTLINNIVNSEAVQTLLRDNPGQPITIVRMPEALQLPKINFPFTPINNLHLNSLKSRKRNGTTLSLRGKRVRKHKSGGTQEEKISFLQFQKSLQVKTRSGRVSKPPLYRVKETLRPKSGEPSNKLKDGAGTEAGEANTNSQQNRSPLDVTGHTTVSSFTSRGQHSIRRGHRGFRGYTRGRRRARGRIGNLGGRSSAAEKFKEVLSEIPDEDLISLVVPRLSEILSPWDFLLMRAFKRRKTEPDKISSELLFKEFEEMLKCLKALSKDCEPQEGVLSEQSQLEFSGELAGLLGTNKVFSKNIAKEMLPANVCKLMEATLEPDKLRSEGVVTDNYSSDSANARPMEQTPKSTKIGDKILGVDTIFPDNALKSPVTNTATETATTSKLSVPNVRPLIEIEPCSESSVDASSMIVNVEELDSSVLHSSANDVNLNQAVQPGDSSIPLESGHSNLHEAPSGLSIQAPSDTLTEAAPLQEQEHTLSDPLPTGASTLGAETVQDDAEVIQGMVPEALPSHQSLQPATAPMVPEGSTILQMADGNFLVQKPDGTAMQIQAPEGMTIETIQALLTVETEVFDQGDPERPGIPTAIQSSDHVPFLSVEDSVAS